MLRGSCGVDKQVQGTFRETQASAAENLGQGKSRRKLFYKNLATEHGRKERQFLSVVERKYSLALT